MVLGVVADLVADQDHVIAARGIVGPREAEALALSEADLGTM